jgi:signal transduction histidine kinase
MAAYRQLDRYLPTLAIVVSLALTALTISAVVRQGRTLESRELLSLQEDAVRHAEMLHERMLGDMNRWMRHLAGVSAEGDDAIDRWVTQHAFLWFAGVAINDQSIRIFPLTPTEAPLPRESLSAVYAIEPLEFDQESLHAALRQYESITEFDSHEEQGYVLLAIASLQRKLGALQAAAATYEQAGELLQPHRRSLRGLFGAYLAAFDCLAARGDRAGAQRELEQLTRAMVQAHVASWGRGEYALIRSRWQDLATRMAPEPVDLWADVLAVRASTRDAVEEIRRVYARSPSPLPSAPRRMRFTTIEGGGGRKLIAASQRIEPAIDIELVAPLDAVITRYWGADELQARYRIVSPDVPGAENSLTTLPESFGGYVILPSAEQLLSLQGTAQRRILLLISVAAGTAMAWGVVIWLILRGLAQQRELVSLQRRFMADVSHELKTPLALIRLHAETLAEGRLRDESRRHAYHETIARESERLTLLLDNILDFSRIEAGRKEYVFAPCDVGQVVLQAWNLFKPRFLSEGFETAERFDPDLPQIMADEQALQQVVINLLQNAFRYGAKGRFVRIRVTLGQDAILVSVRDRGIGMSKAQIRRLGAHFERGTNPEVRKTRGTGLGLAIVKHIVDAHGGELEVTSELGRGSNFTVRLPIGDLKDSESDPA